MGNKYFVYVCKTNYSSEKSKSDKMCRVCRFPKDQTEKYTILWIKDTPNANVRVGKNTVVFALH